MTERLYTVAEVAELLSVKAPTVRTFIRAGRIVAVKIGRDYRVSEQALEKFIAPESVGREMTAETKTFRGLKDDA